MDLKFKKWGYIYGSIGSMKNKIDIEMILLLLYPFFGNWINKKSLAQNEILSPGVLNNIKNLEFCIKIFVRCTVCLWKVYLLKKN